jgi:branched-chain amino acid transport system substrate-binding protein
MRRFACVSFAVLVAALGAPRSAPAAPAAGVPVEINAVLPTTGPAAQLGSKEAETLTVMEAYVNKNGGINGRPVHFAIADDASNPQNSVQLTSALVTKKVNAIVGSAVVATCGAMAPLLERGGPVAYCLSPVIQPPAGSYMFSANVGTKDFVGVILRYFKAHGWTRVALMTTTDSSGHDFQQEFSSQLAGPDAAGLQLVANEQYNPQDISVAAQIARVKAAAPQVLMTFAIGPPFGTLVRNASDAGLTVPIFASSANLSYKQLAGYKTMLKELYFVAGGGAALDPRAPARQQTAQNAFFAAFKDAGVKAEYLHTLAWDPTMILIDALRHIGPEASADALRTYIGSLQNWYGITGRYDFRAVPQRGIARDGAAIYRWDAATEAITTVPLP